MSEIKQVNNIAKTVNVIKKANEEAMKKVNKKNVRVDVLVVIKLFAELIQTKNFSETIKHIPPEYTEVVTIYVKTFGESFAQQEIKLALKSSDNEVAKQLAKKGFPKKLVSVTEKVGKAVVDYKKGNVDLEGLMKEFKNSGIDKIGEQIVSAYGNIDQKVLHNAIKSVGSSTVVYIATTAVYKLLMEELEIAEIAHEHRLEVEKQCNESIELMRQYRNEMEEAVSEYFVGNIEVFEDSFKAMDEAIIAGDSNQYLLANSKIQEILNYKPQFTNQEEFDDLMDSDFDFKS